MDDHTLYERLSAFITPARRALFDRIAPERTAHITVVLEDVFQSHNASAVLRTCDLLGVQQVHAISTRNRFATNPEIALGSEKWITMHHHVGPDAVPSAVEALRAKGYRLIATLPSADAHAPEDLPLDVPLAFCFGTELEGLSADLATRCDAAMRIPMYGFTESYNISVAAGIALYTVMRRLRSSSVAHRLDEEEVLQLKLRWLRTSVHDAASIERRIIEDDARANVRGERGPSELR